jgi:hypothetical protein
LGAGREGRKSYMAILSQYVRVALTQGEASVRCVHGGLDPPVASDVERNRTLLLRVITSVECLDKGVTL